MYEEIRTAINIIGTIVIVLVIYNILSLRKYK